MEWFYVPKSQFYFLFSCSLRHFEHVRRRAPEKAKTQRGSLLMHLRELNTVVNASINILKFLPDVARQFGLTAKSDDAVLKPMVGIRFVTVSGESS